MGERKDRGGHLQPGQVIKLKVFVKVVKVKVKVVKLKVIFKVVKVMVTEIEFGILVMFYDHLTFSFLHCLP